MTLTELIQGKAQRNAPLKVLTHDGIFHLDEALCLAMIDHTCKTLGVRMMLKRSREFDHHADITIDVGGEYIPKHFRFDHHQPGGAGCRPGKKDAPDSVGTSYSSIGLFWKHFGEEFIKIVLSDYSQEAIPEKLIPTIAQNVDRVLIEGICAIDCNGPLLAKTPSPHTPTFNTIFSMLNPSWLEQHDPGTIHDILMGSLPMLANMLIGYIMRETDMVYSRSYVLQCLGACSKDNSNILILETPTQAWRRLMLKNPHIHFIVQPQMDERQSWGVIIHNNAVGNSLPRFPKHWGGLAGLELEHAINVRGALFVHNSGFFAAAETKEALLMMIALARAEAEAFV